MSFTAKRLVATFGAAVLMSGLVPVIASAATAADLQAQLNALMIQLSAMQQKPVATSSASVGAAACDFTKRDLLLGTRGADVSCLQAYLVEQNYLTVAPTGYFGPATQAAVKKWQAARGVSASGYFGALSRRAYGSFGASVASGEVTTRSYAAPAAGMIYSNSISVYPTAGVNPIVAPGSTNQRIASFLIAAPTNQPLRLSSLSFDKDSNAGIVLQNVKLVVNGAAFGAPRAVVNVSEALSFSAASPVLLKQGSTAVVDVYADILATSEIGTYYSVIDMTGLGATGGSNGAYIPSPAEVEGQNVSVTIGGDIYNLAPSVSATSGVYPVIAAGATNQRIASFTITAPANQSIKIASLNLDKDQNEGIDIANVRLLINDVQLGSTIATVGDTETTLAFTGSTPVIVAAGSTRVIDVYADLLSTSVIGSHLSVVDLVSWAITGATTNNALYLPNPVEGQSVTLSSGGGLTVALSNFVDLRNAAVGSIGNELAAFSMSADGVNDLRLTKLTVRATISGGVGVGASLKNLSLWDGSTMVAGPASLSITGSEKKSVNSILAANAVLTFSGDGFVIARNTTKVLTLKGDVVTSAEGAVSNSQYQFRLKSTSDISVVSVNNPAASVVISGIPITSGTVIISAASASLSVAISGATPSSHSIAMGTSNTEVAIFNFTADSSDDLRITDIAIKDVITGGSTGIPSFTTLTLWDESTMIAGPTAMSMAGGESGVATFNISGEGFVIPRNTTKKLVLKGTVASFITGGAVANSKHTFRIASGSDVTVRAQTSSTAKVTVVGAPAVSNTMTIVQE